MKKLLTLLLILPLLFSCGSDHDDSDGFSQRKVYKEELESGTATYYTSKGNTTTYLIFKAGTMRTSIFEGGKAIRGNYFKQYEIVGDSIYLTEKDALSGEDKHYTMYIQIIHWGYDKKEGSNLGGDQLLFRADENQIPTKFQTGYYDKSIFSLE